MPEASITQDRSTFFDRLVDEYRFGSPEDKLMSLMGLISIPLGASATKLPATAQKGLAGILKNYSPKIVNDGGYARELGREIAEEIAVNNAPEARSSEIAQNAVLNEETGLVNLGNGRYKEILPDGSTVTYQGLAGKDLIDARQSVRESPYPEESGFLNLMTDVGKTVKGVVPDIPPAIADRLQRFSEFLNGKGNNEVVATGPRG